MPVRSVPSVTVTTGWADALSTREVKSTDSSASVPAESEAIVAPAEMASVASSASVTAPTVAASVESVPPNTVTSPCEARPVMARPPEPFFPSFLPARTDDLAERSSSTETEFVIPNTASASTEAIAAAIAAFRSPSSDMTK